MGSAERNDDDLAGLLVVIDEVLAGSEVGNRVGITSVEFAEAKGWNRQKAYHAIHKAVKAGLLRPAKITRENLWGEARKVHGYVRSDE